MDKYKKARIIGFIIFCITKAISVTLRIKTIKDEDYKEEDVHLYGFWHGKMFIPMIKMAAKGRKIINIVSPSADGEIVVAMSKRYKYTAIRASSDRAGVKGLIEAIKKIKSGYSLGFAADGPKGPAENAKQGIVYIAQRAGCL